MAGESLVTYGTPKTLESNGAAVTNNNVGVADNATYSRAADGAGFADAKFVFSGGFGGAPVDNSTIVLLARPMNISGTNDAEVPQNGATSFKGVIIGSFVLRNTASVQYVELIAEDVPDEAEYYVWDNATGQTLSAGWTLTVIPRTYVPA